MPTMPKGDGNAMRDLDLGSLRCLLETVRHGSISSAARSLRLAQPALTRRIQLLEEQLGDRLLIRHQRGVEPTESGRLVVRHGEDLLRRSQELVDEVRSAAGKPAGLIRFGFPPSVGSLFVGRILADCIVDYPGVKLHLVENVSPTVRESLIDGTLDMAIMSRRATHESLRVVPLFDEQLWLFASPDLWDLADKTVSLKRLADLPVMLASFLWRQLEPVVGLQVIAAVDALPLAREALYAQAGYGIFPYSALERELARGDLVGAPIEGLLVSRGLFFRRDRVASHAMHLLQGLIDQHVHALKRDRPKLFLPSDQGDHVV